MNIEQTKTVMAELALAGTEESTAFDNGGSPATLISRRAHNDLLMMDVVRQLSDLETEEHRQKVLSLLIAAVSAITIGLTGYVLLG